MEINVKEARDKISALLDRVEEGEEVIILRRGREVARLVPPHNGGKSLPSLKAFRVSLKVTGKPLSSGVIRARKGERY